MKNKEYETDCDGNAMNIRMYNGDLYSFGSKSKIFSNTMVINKEITDCFRYTGKRVTNL